MLAKVLIAVLGFAISGCTHYVYNGKDYFDTESMLSAQEANIRPTLDSIKPRLAVPITKKLLVYGIPSSMVIYEHEANLRKGNLFTSDIWRNIGPGVAQSRQAAYKLFYRAAIKSNIYASVVLQEMALGEVLSPSKNADVIYVNAVPGTDWDKFKIVYTKDGKQPMQLIYYTNQKDDSSRINAFLDALLANSINEE